MMSTGHPASVDFPGLVTSLGAAAAVALNQAEELLSGTAPKQAAHGEGEGEGEARQVSPEERARQLEAVLSHARQMIDTLALLEEKTKGNLEGEEGELLQTTLTQLRMSYVRLTDRSRRR